MQIKMMLSTAFLVASLAAAAPSPDANTLTDPVRRQPEPLEFIGDRREVEVEARGRGILGFTSDKREAGPGKGRLGFGGDR